MIGYIKGVIEEIEEASLLLDHGGMGFRIYVPAALLGQGIHTGDQVKIYTYLHVKEDAMQLYGFFTRDDLEVFRLLLNVNGIGPKAAMGILSALSADDLRFAVLSDDAAFIAKAPGIGKKTAQKLILELKDKLKLKGAPAAQGDNFASEQTGSVMQEATNALLVLGYSRAEAVAALRRVSGALSLEELITAALKQLAKG